MNFRVARLLGLFIAAIWVTRGTSAAEGAVSRGDLLARMERVMGRFPGAERRCDLDVKVTEEVDCGEYVRKFLTYASEPGGERTTATTRDWVPASTKHPTLGFRLVRAGS